MRTAEEIAAMTQVERETAADALLASVDLEPLCRALADLLYDVWAVDQVAETAS